MLAGFEPNRKLSTGSILQRRFFRRSGLAAAAASAMEARAGVSPDRSFLVIRKSEGATR